MVSEYDFLCELAAEINSLLSPEHPLANIHSNPDCLFVAVSTFKNVEATLFLDHGNLIIDTRAPYGVLSRCFLASMSTSGKDQQYRKIFLLADPKTDLKQIIKEVMQVIQ